MTNLERAHQLAARGFYVAPFYAVIDGECNCSPWYKRAGRCNFGKHPVAHGGYNAATIDPKQIDKWWWRYPRRNVGLNTGKSGLMAFDPDARNGGDIVLKELEQELGDLPATWAVQSGSGDVRLVFRTTTAIRTAPIKREGRSLDVIGATGGLIVAGMHPSGNPYVDLGGEISELPDNWLDFLTTQLSLSPLLHSMDYRNGEKGNTEHGNPPPWELTAATWLWSKIRPGETFALYAPVRCLFHPDGTNADAGFFVDAKGYIKLRCFHDQQSHTLEELFATHIRDCPVPKDAKGFGKMRDELYFVSGARRPGVITEDVSGFPEWMQAVHNDLVEALAEHWVSYPGEGVMYTQRFGGGRLKMNTGNVYAATRRLKDEGVIVVSGTAKVGALETLLYTTPAELFRGPTETWKSVKARGLTIEGGAQ